MGIAKDVGEAIYTAAGESSAAPPETGALQLALNIYRPGVIVESRFAQFEADTGVANGRTRIILRTNMHPRRVNFAIARMLARLELRQRGTWSDTVERAVASYLVAPATAVGAHLRRNGFSLPALARRFIVTETCAALRVIEVGASAGVVVTPERVYHPRGGLALVNDDIARHLARSNPRSLRKVVIDDEPGRVALFRKAS